MAGPGVSPHPHEDEIGRLWAVVEATSDLISTATPEGRILYLNRAARRFFGLSDADPPNIEIEDCHSPTAARRVRAVGIPSAIRDGIWRGETELLRADGATVTASQVIIAHRGTGGDVEYLSTIIRDISELKQKEEALRRSEAELRELTAELESRVEARTQEVERQTAQLRALAAEVTEAEQHERRRLSGLLHDHLQQVLVAARMQAELLSIDSDGEVAGSAAGIQQLLVKAIEISRNLSLELSPPVLEEAGLGEALEWLAKHMEERHGLVTPFDGEPEAEPESETLKGMLFEAARELLLNVVKHSGVMECMMRLELDDQGRIRLTVADRGGGFDPSALEASRGEGFGLSKVQRRLEAAAGRCEIESAPGRGARVTLVVHRAALLDVRMGEEPARLRGAARSETRPGPDAVRVLVADDHRLFREGLVQLLRSHPAIEVVGQAGRGEEMIRLARRRDTDVVVVDISMPGMGGVEAIRWLADELEGAKVIALTLHEDAELQRAVRDAGAVACLTKNALSENLIDIILRVASE